MALLLDKKETSDSCSFQNHTLRFNILMCDNHYILQDNQVIILACFISRLVTSNGLYIEEAALDIVVKSLTGTVSKPLSLRDHSEREQALLDLLNSRKLSHLSNEKLLQIALDAKCFRVAEFLYNKDQNYSNIVSCYLNDPMRQSEVFNYILTYISSSDRCIKEQFLVHFCELLKIDAKKTVEIVCEHFSELIEDLNNYVESESDLQYIFLRELVLSDIKLSPQLAERYLELLCVRDKSEVYDYITLNLCRVDIALSITEKHEAHAATALLLEQGGEWLEALDLLLKHGMLQQAILLCVRGSEHLDSAGAQKLWLRLLQNKSSGDRKALRQMLHAAAPHVPPAQLLELVSDASLGDAKVLLNQMLDDCVHDVQVMKTMLKLLGRDLHHGESFIIFLYDSFIIILWKSMGIVFISIER